MTWTITVAAMVLTLSIGAIAASTAASAAPTYGLTISGVQTNPFSAVDGR